MAAAARKTRSCCPDTAASSLYMPTARRPSSGEIVHMCVQDGFPSYKGHILWAWVLSLSRKNLFFEALPWGWMFLADIDSSLTAVRRLWLLRSGDAP